ncbi:MAG: DUF4412 domain-containing protein [Nitrospirales bacterium]|nr:DUF4412 domain-containing protein [Nitrospirales bacterium]
MKTKILLVFLFILALSSSALALELSADSVMTSGSQEKKGKIYFKGDMIRIEQKDPAMVIITRVDKKVVWNLMPKDKVYMEMPFPEQRKPFSDEKFDGETDRKLVGSETIQGHPTKKYLISYTTGSKSGQVYLWWATDIKFPIKTAAKDGSWASEYKNIKTGPQPSSLFEVPAGFQKIQMPANPNTGAVPK